MRARTIRLRRIERLYCSTSRMQGMLDGRWMKAGFMDWHPTSVVTLRWATRHSKPGLVLTMSNCLSLNGYFLFLKQIQCEICHCH